MVEAEKTASCWESQPREDPSLYSLGQVSQVMREW